VSLEHYGCGEGFVGVVVYFLWAALICQSRGPFEMEANFLAVAVEGLSLEWPARAP
jgi:hypothetical protein